VADDGVVYGANLVTTGSAGYRIYRWDNDSAATIPTTIYGAIATSPEQSQRWGDTFDVRGAGTNTQVLAGEQAGGKVAIFTTADGTNFDLHLIATDATNETTRIGLAFGYGNTYWSKSSGNLRKMSFDLTANSGTTLQTYVNTDLSGVALFGIGVDPVNNLLAGVSSTDNPHDVRIYDVGNSAAPPVWLDTELFPTSVANGNNSSFVKFGGGRVYAVDSNNGIMAMTVNYTPVAPVLKVVSNQDGTVTVTWTNPAYTLQSSTTVDSGYADVPSATSPYSEAVSPSAAKFFRLRK
jgi:hypothetical protein